MTEIEQLRTEVAELRAEVISLRPTETPAQTGFKVFAMFFSVQCLYYGMLCWNYRSVAQAWYVSLFVSDLGCAAIAYSLIKKVANAKGKTAQAGYILGGAVGSVISVWLTKLIYGQ